MLVRENDECKTGYRLSNRLQVKFITLYLLLISLIALGIFKNEPIIQMKGAKQGSYIVAENVNDSIFPL